MERQYSQRPHDESPDVPLGLETTDDLLQSPSKGFAPYPMDRRTDPTEALDTFPVSGTPDSAEIAGDACENGASGPISPAICCSGSFRCDPHLVCD